ncbi:MAG: TlpA family protein disulfide reductase [Acidobacteriia bacterium]|nr:TlpA family protein disulfide reductase [Terriglobia bacterium]
MGASTLLLTAAGAATAVGQPGVRAIVQPASERKAAPQLALKDSTGKTISLTDYRGKVVLLDFWATWCTGCKMEIPWFSEFQKAHGAQGFAVVGVSMNESGWTVLKPFLAQALAGSIFSGSMPRSPNAALAFSASNLPSRARRESAAAAIDSAFTSKCFRRYSRLSLRP